MFNSVVVFFDVMVVFICFRVTWFGVVYLLLCVLYLVMDDIGLSWVWWFYFWFGF